MTARLLELLKIRPGETAKVSLMGLYLFLAVSTFITGRISRDTLFLREFDRTVLAYMYITVAVAVPVPAYLYARVADKFRRDRIILTTNAIFALLLVGIWALTLTHQRWVYVFLYNYVELLGAFLMIQFWTFAGDIFASREAKRLFPVVGGGGVVAGIVCGVAVGNIGKTYGAESLLLIMVGMLVCASFIARAVGARERARLQEAIVGRSTMGEKKRFALKSELQDVFKSKHLRIIAGMTVATFITVPLIDYQFKVLAKANFTVGGVPDAPALAHFFGLFYTLTGVIAAFTQFGFAGRVLERFGVVTSLLVLPVALLFGSLGMVIGTAAAIGVAAAPFPIAVFTKGAENSFRYSIYDATMQVIYTPVYLVTYGGRAKTFIDGILKPWSGGLAGGLIALAMGPLALNLSVLSYVAVVLIIAWIVLIAAIRREYVAQLLSSLRRRRLDFSGASLQIADEGTVEVLRKALRSEDPHEVRNALELSGRVVGQDLSEELAALLDREQADLRMKALILLGSHGSMRFTDAIQDRFDDDSEEVRAAAIRAFCAIVGEPALRVVRGQLESSAPQVRGAAVASLIQHGGLEGILMSAEHLKQMQVSIDEELRFAAANVFRDIGVKNFYQPVLALMRDPSLRVQVAAIGAAGAMRSPELIPALIYKLARRETARAAAAALANYGEEITPTLGKVLVHSPEDPIIQQQVPRILERIGGAKSLALLMESLDVDDPDTRLETARAAARLRDRLGVDIDEAPVRKLIDQDLRNYYQLLATLEDLNALTHGGAAGPDLLTDALEERLGRTLNRVFRLLGVVYPLKAIDLIQANLKSGRVTTRSNAVEVLDNLIEKDAKRQLLPIVEDLPREAVLARGEELYDLDRLSPEDWIRRLLDSREAWLVTVALYTVRELGLTDLSEAVTQHLGHPDPVARETALGTLAVLMTPPDFSQVALDMAEDDDDHVRRYSRFMLSQVRGVLGAPA